MFCQCAETGCGFGAGKFPLCHMSGKTDNKMAEIDCVAHSPALTGDGDMTCRCHYYIN